MRLIVHVSSSVSACLWSSLIAVVGVFRRLRQIIRQGQRFGILAASHSQRRISWIETELITNDISMTFPAISALPRVFFSVPNPLCPCPARCFVSSESWPVPLPSASSASPTPPAAVPRQPAAVARLPPPTPRLPAGSAAVASAAGPTPPGGAGGSPAPSGPSPVPLWHRPGRCWESSGPLPPSNLSRPRRREGLGTSQALASQKPFLGIPIAKRGFNQNSKVPYMAYHHGIPTSTSLSSSIFLRFQQFLSQVVLHLELFHESLSLPQPFHVRMLRLRQCSVRGLEATWIWGRAVKKLRARPS